MLRASRLLVALCLAAALAACDDTPGISDTGRPPALSDFQVSPDTFVYEGADPTVSIPISISAAVDEGGGGTTVRYVVRAQNGNEALADGTLEPGDRYTASTAIEVARGAVGNYVVSAIAAGAGGIGNEVTALVRYTAPDLGPPVITSATADPNPVASPGSFTVSAAVQDPDGLANIARVELESGGAEFRLCDDGGVGVCGFGGTDLAAPSGDGTAGDGTFSRRFQVPAGQEPGDLGFVVRAFDRAGLASDPVLIIVSVQ